MKHFVTFLINTFSNNNSLLLTYKMQNSTHKHLILFQPSTNRFQLQHNLHPLTSIHLSIIIDKCTDQNTKPLCIELFVIVNHHNHFQELTLNRVYTECFRTDDKTLTEPTANPVMLCHTSFHLKNQYRFGTHWIKFYSTRVTHVLLITQLSLSITWL